MKTDEDLRPTTQRPRQRRSISGLILTIIVVLALAVFGATMNGLLRRGPKEAADPCAGKGLSCQQDQVWGPNDPCRWVRITDAERVLGVFFPAIPGRTPDKCFIAGPGNFSVRVIPKQGTAEYRAAIRSLKDRLSLGTEAYWDPREGVLHILVGDAYLAVQVTEIQGAREKAITVAGLALLKLIPPPKALS